VLGCVGLSGTLWVCLVGHRRALQEEPEPVGRLLVQRSPPQPRSAIDGGDGEEPGPALPVSKAGAVQSPVVVTQEAGAGGGAVSLSGLDRGLVRPRLA